MAIMAGAIGAEIELLAAKLISGGRVRADVAQSLLKDLRSGKS
jgi:hypothetical protein